MHRLTHNLAQGGPEALYRLTLGEKLSVCPRCYPSACLGRMRIGLTGRGVWEHGLQCPSDVDLSETGAYGANTFLEVQASIVSEAVVAPALKVDYRAGTEVHLTPGFHASDGSRFHAFIHPCDMPGNSFNPKSAQSDGGAWQEEREHDSSTQALVLFPNPTSGSLSVLCNGLSDESTGRIRFFDATGRQVLTTNMQGRLKVLDVSSLKGLITVVVDTPIARFVERVIVE